MDLSIKGTDDYKSLLLEQKIALLGVMAGGNTVITGGGGVGKSRLIKTIGRALKGVVLTSTTGGSAIDILGETIDTFMGFRGKLIEPEKAKRMPPQVRERLKDLKYLLIDEASMLRRDKFECIDLRLRSAKKKMGIPFGGVQLILVGDFCQFLPVLNSSEKEIYNAIYGNGVLLFNSETFRRGEFIPYVLTDYVRQQGDSEYRAVMKALRLGRKLDEVMNVLNRKSSPTPHPDAVYLCTTRKKAEKINQDAFSRVGGDVRTYHAKKENEFKESLHPTQEHLSLKVGARVMVLANNAENGYYNGDVGTVKSMHLEFVTVSLDRGGVVDVKPHKWEAIKYESGKNGPESSVDGSFEQIPLCLAYAMTMHKAQGKTLPYISLDFGNWVTDGSAYVGFSRTQSFKGIHLARPLRRSDLVFNKESVEFTIKISQEAMARRESDLEKFGLKEAE